MSNKLSYLIILKLVFIFTFTAFAASNSTPSKEINWEFDGIFGRFDKQSIQRGFKVYKEVCSSCHSIRLIAYRNLSEIGFSKDEIKVFASQYIIKDGPNDNGDMFERNALPSDRFVPPFENEQLARLSNGGALPPDLSLMVKAKKNGANYIYSILTGFEDAPIDFTLEEGKYYNPYFEGSQISMPPPFEDESVEYTDGVYPSKEQVAIDVVNFLHFIAEPEMEQRKKMGIKVIIFLLIMTVLFMIAKKRAWKHLL